MDLLSYRQEISKKISIGNEVLYLTKSECENSGISTERILELTKETLIEHGKKEYEMPAKIGVHPYPEVFFHAMPAYVPALKSLGCKWIECYPNNPTKFNLPQTTGLLIMNDIMSGCPIAIMDCTWITAMRTPAVTVLAAEKLDPDAETFGMFGCGVQGIGHVRFIVKTLKKLKKIYIYDVREEMMDKLIEIVQPEIDVEIVKAKTPKEVAEKCKVMSSATLITHDTLSIVKDEWISKGQTILPCDLNTFWDPKTTKRADKYFVDSIEEHELFNKMGYFPDGLCDINAETGEILANIKHGRENKDELIVCSNIGMAVCDVVLGREVLDVALANGMGKVLPL